MKLYQMGFGAETTGTRLFLL